jgi:gluconolactonase
MPLCLTGLLLAGTLLVFNPVYSAPDSLSTIVAGKVEKVAGGFQFIEGPVWQKDGSLLFSDIPANAIMRWKPGTKVAVWRKPSGHTNGNTLDYQGRLISCEHDRRVSRTEKSGKVVTIADKYKGMHLNSPNDAVVKSDSSVYFTDPPYGIKPEQEELGFSGVYRLDKKGQLTLLVKDFQRPNGLAFSPDEKRLYIADSQEMHIRAFDVKPDGTLTNGRLFATMKDTKEGVPDGMRVDSKGNVFCTGAGGVWVFAPSGKLLGRIETPEPPANCAFGDSDFKTLYITARTTLYRVRLKNAGVRPGIDKPQ